MTPLKTQKSQQQKKKKISDVFLRKILEKYSQLFSNISSQIFFDFG